MYIGSQRSGSSDRILVRKDLDGGLIVMARVLDEIGPFLLLVDVSIIA